jgi:methyl-accepting chemotaxis protein
MTDVLNDRFKVNLILAVLFILGIGVSLYFIYSLPANLRLADGFQPAFVKVYIVIGLTLVLGAAAIIVSLRYKKEILVYRDRIIDTKQAERDAAEQAGKTTISLENVISQLRHSTDEKSVLQSGLQTICKQLEAGQGAVYSVKESEGKRKVELKGGYALNIGESAVISFEFGEGLVGQSAATGKTLYIDEIPDGYINIISGLGSASPRYLLIVPMKHKEEVLGVLEIASFTPISEDQRKFAEEATQLIAEKVKTQA